jgi:hypothetical protein
MKLGKKLLFGVLCFVFVLGLVIPISLPGIAIASTKSVAHNMLTSVNAESESILSPPTTEWNKTFGTSSGERAYDVCQTNDGGYIVTGVTGINFLFTHSYSSAGDLWLMKIDASGNKQWEKTFGGSNLNMGYCVKQTTDGGYIISGITNVYGFNWGDAPSYGDVWLIKTDALGNKEWDKVFGGSAYDEARSVCQTSDGGFILGGGTRSYTSGWFDVWLIKTDGYGNEQWSKNFGGGDGDCGYSVQQDNDGGYVVLGYTFNYGAGATDIWLIKTDASGNKVWDKTYGGSSGDAGLDLKHTSDGGYIIVGQTNSFGSGGSDAWLLKTDSSGTKQWDKTFGGSGDETGFSIDLTNDGGYVFAGWTTSFGSGGNDIYVVKTDSNGNEVWHQTYGGSGDEFGLAIQATTDGGYIVAGLTTSFGSGGEDAWLIKLAPPASGVGRIVLTDALTVTPSAPYSVGDTLTTTFTVENQGDADITLDKLLLGGRFNGGELTGGGYPDFTYQTVILQPGQSHQYQGTFTIPEPGNYGFFIAYYIANPTETEKAFLDVNNWNTCIELGAGLTDADRTEQITATIANPIYTIYATREGLVGQTTANGHVIQTGDHFVALPSTKALCSNGGTEYQVRITYAGKSVVAPVWDVGPWNTKDDYWNPPSQRETWQDLSQGMPEAQAAYQDGYNSGNDQFGRTVTNPAGIDLADGTFWNDLGMTNNDWVQVEFLFLTPPTDITPPTVDAFSVTPDSVTLGDPFTISYTVSDTGGSGLNRVELWRRSETQDWVEINRTYLPGVGNGPYTGSFSDTSDDVGSYYYGIHVVDDAGNWAAEGSPVMVRVTSTIVIVSPLEITPAKSDYQIGDLLTARYSVQNIGNAPIVLDSILVGGRLNGATLANGMYPDFTAQSVTLNEGEMHQYEGTLTLSQVGNYHFFCCYHTPAHLPGEDDNNWNCNVDVMVNGNIPSNSNEAPKYREKDIIISQATVIKTAVGPASWEPLHGPWDDWPRNQIYQDTNSISAMVVNPVNPEEIYVAALHESDWKSGEPIGAKLFKSVDGGSTWTEINNGFQHTASTSPYYMPIGAIAIAPSTPQTIYVGTTGFGESGEGSGLYKSIDRGATWSECNGSVSPPPAGSTSPVVAYFPKNERVSSIAVDPHDANVVYVGTEHAGMYKTIDGGTQWFKIWRPIGQLIYSINRIEIPKNNSNVVYAAIYNMANYLSGGDPGIPTGLVYRGGLFKYENATWECIFDRRVDDIWIDNTGNAIRIVTNGYDVFESQDGGVSWSSICGTGEDLLPDPMDGPWENPGFSLATYPDNTDWIFVGSDRNSLSGKSAFGVHFSPDDGTHWFPIGLQDEHVTGISVESTSGHHVLYATTWRSWEYNALLFKLDFSNSVIAIDAHSPIELSVYDSAGRVTGILSGQVKAEIPTSVFSEETVVILQPMGDYTFRVVGMNAGIYGITAIYANGSQDIEFMAFNIPTSVGAVHQYTIDWAALSQGDKGVTLQIDSNGDGIFEQTINSDSTLQPPVAEAGPDQTVERTSVAGAQVTLDGSGSYDPDGDPLTYTWTWAGGSATGVSPTLVMPMGTTVVTLELLDGALTDSDTVAITVLDTTPPLVTVEFPTAGLAVQDGITLKASASDLSGVDTVYFYIREPDGAQGKITDPPCEDLPATLNAGIWEYNFDTLKLDDGKYIVLAKGVDTYDNEGWSTAVPFSIRNWAVIELLPSTPNNKPGRTMPVKFAMRVKASVDPAQPFVYNDDLTIKIFAESNPLNILQTSTFGSGSRDYRIENNNLYITNFQTSKTAMKYKVEIYRGTFWVGSFTFNTTVK